MPASLSPPFCSGYDLCKHALEAAFARVTERDPTLRAWALRSMGCFALRVGDQAAARAYSEQGLALSREAGDRFISSRLLNTLAILSHNGGDLPRARSLYDECASLCESAGDAQGMAMVLNNRSLVEVSAGDLAAAVAALERCVALSRTAGYVRWLARALVNRGWVSLKLGDHAQAIARCVEAARLCEVLGFRLVLGHCITILAGVAYHLQQPTRAVRLFAAAAVLYSAIGVSHDEPIPAESDWLIATLRAHLGDETFNAAWLAGSAMPSAEAVDDAVVEFGAPTGQADTASHSMASFVSRDPQVHAHQPRRSRIDSY